MGAKPQKQKPLPFYAEFKLISVCFFVFTLDFYYWGKSPIKGKSFQQFNYSSTNAFFFPKNFFQKFEVFLAGRVYFFFCILKKKQ